MAAVLVTFIVARFAWLLYSHTQEIEILWIFGVAVLILTAVSGYVINLWRNTRNLEEILKMNREGIFYRIYGCGEGMILWEEIRHVSYRVNGKHSSAALMIEHRPVGNTDLVLQESVLNMRYIRPRKFGFYTSISASVTALAEITEVIKQRSPNLKEY
ncbi:hypothetical protein BG910_00480 [Neisseria chenwenguii]|uniref:Uncharacterized protein n=1 Tax=Neisseria chenwenguii TaxID=1853278 RepID=A0A220RZ12_9NEIS|nr:hypothetical protein BG910_00480 [Neisseria chenwenguii]